MKKLVLTVVCSLAMSVMAANKVTFRDAQGRNQGSATSDGRGKTEISYNRSGYPHGQDGFLRQDGVPRLDGPPPGDISDGCQRQDGIPRCAGASAGNLSHRQRSDGIS